MTVFDSPIRTLDGRPTTLRQLATGRAVLVVNVASHCGLTRRQYTGLEQLQRELGPRGFTVIGVPCNQFAGQEPGGPDEIRTFCDTRFGVTFALTEKVDVNGEHRHPLFAVLTAQPDADGTSGDLRWNFEKFVLAPDGQVVARFGPRVLPTDPAVVAAIERVLPHAPEPVKGGA